MPDLLTILTATSPFWWKATKRGTEVLIDAAEDVLSDEAKKQARNALKPILDRLDQPEAQRTFDEAFGDACKAYLGRYGGGERELPRWSDLTATDSSLGSGAPPSGVDSRPACYFAARRGRKYSAM